MIIRHKLGIFARILATQHRLHRAKACSPQENNCYIATYKKLKQSFPAKEDEAYNNDQHA